MSCTYEELVRRVRELEAEVRRLKEQAEHEYNEARRGYPGYD
jgi:cell division protein FtsB